MKKILMTFPQGKFKVLTMSYDDGKQADRRLVKLFNTYGIKGTFHVNYGLMGEADPSRIAQEEVASLYEGHEVSAHTLTHPTIARCPKEQLIHEMIEDRKGLEGLVGYTVRGLSYPNGSFNKQIKEMLPYLGLEYARVTKATAGFGMPDDWMEWQPTCHHNHDLLQLGEAFTQLFKSQYLYMMYVWGHSYEFDNDNNWELMERFCEQVGGREDTWYATNIEIVDYVKAFQQLKFSAAGSFVYNPSARSVWISVDGSLVEIGGGAQVSLEV